MLPGESNEWQANDGVTLFTKPPEKDKIIYGSEIPEFGDGSHRQRYPLEFKLKAIEYAQSVVEGGKGTGGTVGLSCSTRAFVIARQGNAGIVDQKPVYVREGGAAGDNGVRVEWD